MVTVFLGFLLVITKMEIITIRRGAKQFKDRVSDIVYVAK